MTDGFKLFYFNFRARAEPIRLVFAAANVEYEDVRIPMEEWPQRKVVVPGKRLPYLLTPEGKVLTQSMAIARSLAAKHDLYPTDPCHIFLVERAIGQAADVCEEIYKYFFAPADKKEELAKDFEANKGKLLLEGLSSFLEEDEERIFFAGSKLTLADLFYLNLHDFVHQFFPTLLEQFPRLQKLVDTVKESNEGVAKWLATRPETPL